VKHLGLFAIRVLKGFRANQGLLLAGAVAYYALLSIVPLMILTVIALSYVIEEADLLQTVARYLEWLVPGQSGHLRIQSINTESRAREGTGSAGPRATPTAKSGGSR